MPYRQTAAYRAAVATAAAQRANITHRVATLTDGRAPSVVIRTRKVRP